MKLIHQSSYEAGLSSHCSNTKIFFFEEYNLVVEHIKYNNDKPAILYFTGGTEENRQNATSKIQEIYPNE